MTAKEYLERGWRVEQRVRAREEQLKRLRDRMARIKSSAPKGPAGDRRGIRYDWTDAVDALSDAEAEYVRDIAKLCQVDREIRGAISGIETELYREILEYRYLYCMGWEEIAQRLEYDRRYVYKLHERALKEMDAAREAMERTEDRGE